MSVGDIIVFYFIMQIELKNLLFFSSYERQRTDCAALAKRTRKFYYLNLRKKQKLSSSKLILNSQKGLSKIFRIVSNKRIIFAIVRSISNSIYVGCKKYWSLDKTLY